MAEPRPSMLARAAESAQAAALSRFGLPLMLTVIAFFLVRTLDRIETTQAAAGVSLAEVRDSVASARSDVRDLNTRLDAQVLRQVDANTKRGDDHEARLRALESHGVGL